MRTVGKQFQSVHKLLVKLQDPRGIDQPLPSILGVGEERDQTKLVLPEERATELGYQKPPDPDCECPERWPWKDTPNVPHHLAAQQDAEWVQRSGLLALGDDDDAALAEQWTRSAAALAQGKKSPAGG